MNTDTLIRHQRARRRKTRLWLTVDRLAAKLGLRPRDMPADEQWPIWTEDSSNRDRVARWYRANAED